MIEGLKSKKRIRMLAIVMTLTFLLTGAVAAYAASGGVVIVDGEPEEVPQKMMPGSVIIYDSQLQPRVIKGGYIENETQQNVETEDSVKDSILKCLKPVPITDDMTAAEKELVEWENRLVSGLKEQIVPETLTKTLFQPTIYPGMKVVYDEITGDINNIYYPDADDPSGYSIHNIPTDSNQLITRAAPVYGQPYGAHNNVITYQSGDDSFLGVGRATYFTGSTDNRDNPLKNGDCATQIDLDYSKVGDKDVSIRNLNTDRVFTFYQASVGGLPDACIDIWGLSNLRNFAEDQTVTSVYQVDITTNVFLTKADRIKPYTIHLP